MRKSSKRPAYAQAAVDFYEQKLIDNPTMPKYNQYLAAIADSEGDKERAGQLYRTAVGCSPGDVMIRNDYALHLQKHGEQKYAERELKKALLIVEEQPTIHMNLGAVYARRGDYQSAMEHCKRAKEVRTNVPMNLRNLAKVQSVTGDTRSALRTNMEAIRLEQQGLHGGRINTDVYRAAAVQHVSKGDTEGALQLVRDARLIGGKHYVSPTTARTNEIIGKLLMRKGNMVEQIEREAKEKEDRDRALLLRKKAQG